MSEQVRKSYTVIARAKCQLITIEAIAPLDSAADFRESIDQALSNLQQYGSADVVSIETICEDLDQAHRILQTRRVKNRYG